MTANLQPAGLPTESVYTNGFALLIAVSVAGVIAAALVPSRRRNLKGEPREAPVPTPSS